ncbi:NRDE family protein [Salegentibacter sediminis]|uniref:NRDE family protein n=1 Tax=Salegentibacter sediminis TaxID=1930251 RepID=UPI0009BCC18B|nr:NRDE family protein [Salegentibacter sediminis]
MCTISLAPLSIQQNSFVLTFNRDEIVERQTLPPDYENINGSNLIMPKDKRAGGTWIGGSSKKRVVCLMNGEFKPHQRNLPYRLSRGLVVKEFLAAENAIDSLEKYNFDGVEAFTLILADWKTELEFFELVWDEKRKHIKQLELVPHIWSSSPLYSEVVKTRREEWFAEIRGSLNPENILNFHHNAGIGDKEQDLVMDRGFLKTQSISQIIAKPSHINFWYRDLNTSQITEKKLKL